MNSKEPSTYADLINNFIINSTQYEKILQISYLDSRLFNISRLIIYMLISNLKMIYIRKKLINIFMINLIS